MSLTPLSNLTVQPDVAYDVDLDPTLKAIDILKEGTLRVIDIEDNQVDYEFIAFVAAGGEYTTFPYRLNLRIKRIVGDGSGSVGTDPETDIALADLVGLH